MTVEAVVFFVAAALALGGALGVVLARNPVHCALLLVVTAAAEARTVIDSAGRKVEVPDKIEKVFAAGPPASILLYMLAPDKMTGWPNPPTPDELTAATRYS